MFLAMAYERLSRPEKASEWYDRAVAWLEQQQQPDPELSRFRAEAQQLLKPAKK